ncbi:MAG: hypothetical protein HUU01_10875 [Saprospiraceae bacterium]|nr:hypothetical protein [Saprospiraceae bacterium]
MANTRWITACFALFTFTVQAQFNYSGIFQKTDIPHEYADNLTWSELQQRHMQMDTAGYQLTDVELAKDNNKINKYWAIWAKTKQHSVLATVAGWDSLVQKRRDMAKEGFVLTELEGQAGPNNVFLFTGVWTTGKTAHKAWKLDSWAGLVKKNEEMAKDNFFLVDVDATPFPDGTMPYVALYHYGQQPDQTFLFEASDLTTFNTERARRHKSGYRLLDYEQFEHGEREYYVGIYKKGTFDDSLRAGLDEQGFQKLRTERAKNESIYLTDIEITRIKTSKVIQTKKKPSNSIQKAGVPVPKNSPPKTVIKDKVEVE